MIYLLWLLPILVAAIMFIIYKSVDVFKISGAALIVVIIYTFIHQSCAEASLTDDTEWWGNYATSVHYYDDWDEEVPCRHSYQCNCKTTTDSKGNSSTSCQTCYEHAYDVDYHSEYWTIRWDNGSEFTISQSEYFRWTSLWGGKVYKIELNRDYYKNDGDDLACNWDETPEHSESCITEKTYENRVQASKNVFRADKVDSTDRKQYKLFEYPECTLSQQKIVLGHKISNEQDKLLKYINGYYGSKKQFKLFMCVWKDMSEIAAERQHSYWDNLNKNEFLVCLGTNAVDEIQWVKCYSWMDRPTLGVVTEQYFRDNKKLDITKFAKWLPGQIETNWSRKRFRDFKYLKVEITFGQYTAMFIVVTLLSILQAYIIYQFLNGYETRNIKENK